MPVMNIHDRPLIADSFQFMCIIYSHVSVTICVRFWGCIDSVVGHLVVRPEELVGVRATKLGDEYDIHNHLGVNEGTRVSFRYNTYIKIAKDISNIIRTHFSEIHEVIKICINYDNIYILSSRPVPFIPSVCRR